MLHESTRRLIAKLCEMTERAEIAWREPPGLGPDTPVRSRFDTEGYAVEVQADPPDVRVLRADGRELERALAADLEQAKWADGDGTFADHVRRMAQRAARVSSGAEHAIETILSALSAPPAPKGPEIVAPEIVTSEIAAPDLPALQNEDAKDAPARAAQLIALTRSPNAERFGASFGAVNSFSRAASAAETPKPQPQSLLQTGISAVTRQTTDGRPAPQPAPADVYKPWH